MHTGQYLLPIRDELQPVAVGTELLVRKGVESRERWARAFGTGPEVEFGLAEK